MLGVSIGDEDVIICRTDTRGVGCGDVVVFDTCMLGLDRDDILENGTSNVLFKLGKDTKLGSCLDETSGDVLELSCGSGGDGDTLKLEGYGDTLVLGIGLGVDDICVFTLGGSDTLAVCSDDTL